MFNGVQGEGIKRFFQGRKGRNLSFASQKPVKVQAGADIVEIATGAVSRNTENLIISSLKATIKNLETQLAVHKDAKLEAKLVWAKEYLTKFEAEVARLKKTKPAPAPTPNPNPKPNPVPAPNPEEHKNHELKTLLASIKLQSTRVLESVTRIPFVLVQDNMEKVISKIDILNEQVRLYEQSVKSYVDKGGTEAYEKITISEKRLKVIYKIVAKKVEDLKDELKNNPTSHEIKNNISTLEKLANDLIKFAETPEIYNRVRTEIDKELADARKPIITTEPKEPEEPAKPLYQDDVDAYEAELHKLNEHIKELNKYIARLEALVTEKNLTPELIDEYITLEDNVKKASIQIESSKVALASKNKAIKDTHKIEVTKLPSVQTIKIEKVTYTMHYNIYIELLDRKAIEAIHKIKELELSKSKAKKEDIPKINEEITKLYKFLLAINSLIDKRIVQYSKVNRKNIAELYKARHNRRKIIAEEYELGTMEPITVIPEGKTEIEVFKEQIIALSEKWLKAIRTAPISRSGKLIINEEPFVVEMSTLIANSHDNERLQAIMETSEKFNKARAQILKEKRAALSKFRTKVMTRIQYIFQSGTISETVKPEIDYNEWLTQIEYNELILLSLEPEFKNYIPNTEQLIKEYIGEQEKKYLSIKKKTQFKEVEALSEEFAVLIAKVETIPMDENFEANVTAFFEAMKEKYKVLKDFNYSLNIAENKVEVSYMSTKYEFSSGTYKIVPESFEHVIMSQTKLKEYQVSRNLVKPEQPEEDELHKPKIVVEGEEPSDIKVTNRTIKLATNRRQVINRAKNLIIANADSLTVSLIRQGLRIRYNENLRDQLRALNAKLSLVNKSVYQSRKDIKFDGDETEQDLAFKGPKENFKIEDYKLEVRLMNEGKKPSDLLYSYDLENISDELHGRTK